MNLKAKMHERLTKREEQIAKWLRQTRQNIDKDKIGGEPGRLWLEKFSVGKGLNICCGDFSIGDSIGVDTNSTELAMDLWTQGDQLVFEPETFDFIVTNYFEAFNFPLKTLLDWNILLRVNGILALVCMNSDKYEGALGPLINKKRVNCFTQKTISCYLNKAGFVIFETELQNKEIWIASRKKE